MISRLAAGLARASVARAPTAAPALGLYAARPRSFAWTRSLRSERDPKSKPESQPENGKSTEQPGEEAKPEDGKAAEEAKEEDGTPTDADGKPFPLPDLTQGIPSTLEYEVSRTADPLTRPPGEDGRRELPASAYISSSDRKRQSFAKWSFIMALATMAGGAAYMGRDWETEEEAARNPDAPAGWSPVAFWKRAVARSNGVVTYFAEPAFETLLPKVDPMLEKPYTLCISLEDMLVHSEWSREHGWRVAKRPGVDYFLRYLSQYYELVLFTSVPSAVALPVIQKLDPFQMIMFPLFREATKYKDGEFVKVSTPLPTPPALTSVSSRDYMLMLLRTSPTSTATSPRSSSSTRTTPTSPRSPRTPS